ncbi:MAG: DUF499 domain-containing protein [Melioribacteraceae bacterium]|nr:DUF499 domain-containing protein [Melioribacteraceae bacterium]
MKPFHSIAVPHRDILEGKLTMNVFAADLYEVSKNSGPDEYKDADTFFKKTYLTQGLKSLLQIVERRLKGEGGEPIIQLKTPFGGGKTHSLISMYHKADEWKANKAVIVGTSLKPKDTLWGIIEKQLTGKVELCEGFSAPGRETLKELLEAHQPFIILMDEVLEYATKAATVDVGRSNLAAQTIAFMQELTETVATIEKAALVVTLPSSVPEHYDDNAESLFVKLEKVAGRMERIYTPVDEDEITKILRRRLFSSVNEAEAKKIVEAYVDHADKESILPTSIQPSEYRDLFLASYPFTPEVVEVLYTRWGSFPSFQRTRGVLRLLSLVIYSLKSSDKSFISLADFNLAEQETRQELIKHIGTEYNGIIAADITDKLAGAKKVNARLGKAYQGMSLGEKSATAIFLYSFSGGTVKGATLTELKRAASLIDTPSSIIGETVSHLEKELFYLQSIDHKYFFSNQPNLNRILVTYMENIKDEELAEEEEELLKLNIKMGAFNTYLWASDSSIIRDDEELKLVILKQKDEQKIAEMITTKGKSPRVFRNRLFFLFPSEHDKSTFTALLKRKIAYEKIKADKNLNLSDEQKRVINKEYEKAQSNAYEALRKYYRLVGIPAKDGYQELDLGVPTYGETKSLTQEIYDKLRAESAILERIAPLVLKSRYLEKNKHVSTAQIFQAMNKTPGEIRINSKTVLEDAIVLGVQQGMFGLGEIIEDEVKCHYFKKYPSIAFTENEVLIVSEICEEQMRKPEGTEEVQQPSDGSGATSPAVDTVNEPRTQPQPQAELFDEIEFDVTLPKGKVSSLMGMMNYIQSKFETLEVKVNAKDGKMTKQEYQDKIEEALRQIRE